MDLGLVPLMAMKGLMGLGVFLAGAVATTALLLLAIDRLRMAKSDRDE